MIGTPLVFDEWMNRRRSNHGVHWTGIWISAHWGNPHWALCCKQERADSDLCWLLEMKRARRLGGWGGGVRRCYAISVTRRKGLTVQSLIRRDDGFKEVMFTRCWKEISTGKVARVYVYEKEHQLVFKILMYSVPSTVLSIFQVLNHLNSHNNCMKQLTVSMSILSVRKLKSKVLLPSLSWHLQVQAARKWQARLWTQALWSGSQALTPTPCCSQAGLCSAAGIPEDLVSFC